ncbi:MAG: response regulator [Treponema sp.]|jgi:PAS domain S-box-containing protein|nr:response regulator [Treponema sp.]
MSEQKTIMAVDDETANLAVLNQILSPEYQILTAKSGEEALRLAAEHRPDLILLDIMMPGMDGFSVLGTLKAAAETAAIPVIFVTGRDGAGDEEKGFSLGAADYITKPFRSMVVKARVSAHLKSAELLRITSDDLRRMTSIVEDSPDFVLYLGKDNKVEYINSACAGVTGFSREEFTAAGFSLILGGEDLRWLNEEYLKTAINQKSCRFEMTITRKDGEKRDLLFSAFSVVLRNGEPRTGITGRDITGLRRLQRELVSAKEQAEYYSKAKSDFLSRMSHEMRTPMNAVIGMTALAKNAVSSEERSRYFTQLDSAAQDLLGIINDMLDMAKIDAGDFDLNPKPFVFQAAVQAVVAAINPLAQAKRQNFSAVIDPDIPPRIIADERRIKQILLNLLANAVKFTGGGGTVSLLATAVTPPAGTGAEPGQKKCGLCFEVRDNGAGISPEQQQRLFGAFEQADNSITRTHGGTGLGLAITGGIVALMNGKIEVESEPGNGSCFRCSITVDVDDFSAEQTAPVQDAADGRAASGPGGNDPQKLKGARILVVDDIEMNRELIVNILKESGAVLESAAGGAEAVDKFMQNPFNMVLMDLHMPEMDGFEASRRIRNFEKKRPGVPIVAITADAGINIKVRCMEAGMTGSLRKPIDRGLLLQTIERYL